jgi:hypothetical protein
VAWLAIAVVVATAAPASADGLLHRLVAATIARVDAAARPRVAAPPALVPPTPVGVTWRAQRVASLELGAPLLALASGDGDGDGRDELYALTTREVIAFALGDHRVRELGRVALAGPPAAAPSRDVVGTLRVDHGEIVAATSGFAHGLRLRWQAHALVGSEDPDGLSFCRGEAVTRAPGRNVFGVGPTALLAVRCRDDLIDGEGHHLRLRAELGVLARLEVELARCDGATCAAPAHHAHAGVGVAFELADVDRDGRPELIAAAAGAPGEPDALRVIALGQDERRPLFRRAFTGGVAGVAALDLDPHAALVVVAAVRLVGADRVDLWRFD